MKEGKKERRKKNYFYNHGFTLLSINVGLCEISEKMRGVLRKPTGEQVLVWLAWLLAL